MERYVAVDNVCAWPNLTKTSDNGIIAAIFNQPCHGKWEGEVECWASADGRFWEKRGVPALHEPGENRMNVAAGTANDGDLLVIVSGWDNRPSRPEPPPVFPHDKYDQPAGTAFSESSILSPLVCRSNNGGRSWEREEIKKFPESVESIIPFGDILAGEGGMLGAGCYGSGSAWFMASRDDGRTWSEYHCISRGFVEPALLYLGGGTWLAAARSAGKQGVVLFRSEDGGKSWAEECRLSLAGQHPGHLLLLSDGRILFSCGLRNTGFRGVTVCLSEDGGKSWSVPVYLAEFDSNADGGYPSSVQTGSDVMVTAYYSSDTPGHRRYHMGVLRWRLSEI